jgi:GAF domain-containing protein
MIGWSIQHRQHKIALDVGIAGENFFKNKYLPDTHSELALPLYSKGEVIGALTVQSIERNAFSNEDITVLQTMADQLANAIANARLFETVARARHEAESRLHESIAMQQFSQTLASTLYTNEILEMFFQACTKIIGFDYVQIAMVSQDEIQAVAGIGVSEQQLRQTRQALTSDGIMAHVIRTGKTEIISGWDDCTPDETEGQTTWVSILTPITLRQRHIGLVEAGFKETNQITIDDGYVRLLKSFIDQAVLALDNAQRYDTIQRTARREEIIREVTGKIRGALNVDEILQTAVTELGHALGAKQGGIRLMIVSNASLAVGAESISLNSKRNN